MSMSCLNKKLTIAKKQFFSKKEIACFRLCCVKNPFPTPLGVQYTGDFENSVCVFFIIKDKRYDDYLKR